MIANFIGSVVEYFDMSEKDIIMFAFFGVLLAIMFLTWALEDAAKWIKRNYHYHIVEVEYIQKICLAPILSLVLMANGCDAEERKSRVSNFIYG